LPRSRRGSTLPRSARCAADEENLIEELTRVAVTARIGPTSAGEQDTVERLEKERTDRLEERLEQREEERESRERR